MSVIQLQKYLNLRQGRVEKALKILNMENPAPVIKQGRQWHRTPVPFKMNRERIERLTRQRQIEWQEVQGYIDNDGCLMAYLQNALNDLEIVECGRCSVCRGGSVIGAQDDRYLAIAAGQFLRRAEISFKPKKQVAADAFEAYGFRGNLPAALQASEGRILLRWGDAGWGSLVADDKRAGHFRDELVETMAAMIEQRWQPAPTPEWVMCVPSRRHPAWVPDFAQRLAARLGLPFVVAIHKVRDNEPQKRQQNRFHQCKNLDGAFKIAKNIPETPALLVDDITDSGWTMTVLAALLRQAGSTSVYPVALASASSGD